MSPTRLVLVRHAEAEVNAGGVLSSVAPGLPLTPRGQQQAAELAGRLSPWPIEHVHSSPVLRALQTAGALALALDLDLTFHEGLREFGLGRREGTPGTNHDVFTHASFGAWLDGERLDDRFDGGESGTEIVGRMRSALTTIAHRHAGRTVAVVSHGGAIAVAVANLCPELSSDTVRSHFPENCAAVVIDRVPAGWRLVHWPGTPPHLDDVTAQSPSHTGEPSV